MNIIASPLIKIDIEILNRKQYRHSNSTIWTIHSCNKVIAIVKERNVTFHLANVGQSYFEH